MSGAEGGNGKVFKQDLDQECEFQNVFFIHLLFEDDGPLPSNDAVIKALKATFGEADTVASTEGLSTFAIPEYIVEYADGNRVPAQVLMSNFEEFDHAEIDEMSLSRALGLCGRQRGAFQVQVQAHDIGLHGIRPGI